MKQKKAPLYEPGENVNFELLDIQDVLNRVAHRFLSERKETAERPKKKKKRKELPL